MSRTARLAAAAIVIALAATVTAIVADNGRATPQHRYQLSLDSTSPVVTGTSRGATVQAPRGRYRLNLAGNTINAAGPRPNCHYLTWQAATDGR